MQRSLVQVQNLANFYNLGANVLVPMPQIIQLVDMVAWDVLVAFLHLYVFENRLYFCVSCKTV